jgi:hypothetical protein
VNLARRTVLGLAQHQVADGLIEAARAIDGVNLDVADPTVQGPAVQVLPLAIYI